MCSKVAGLLLLSILSISSQNARPNFTGAWKCQEYEIDRIDHREPIFNITPHVRRADVLFGYSFRTDNQTLRTKSGGVEIERTGHWEGNYLVLETKREHGQTTEKVTLSLWEDGQHMTKHTQVVGPGNEKKVDDIAIYNKIESR